MVYHWITRSVGPKASFVLQLTEQQVQLLSPETAGPERLRDAMEMLKKCCSKVGNEVAFQGDLVVTQILQQETLFSSHEILLL